MLQGWAVVENTTDDDWNNVQDGAGQRPADQLPDGPVSAAVRAAADGRAGTVRVAAAADLRRGDDESGATRGGAAVGGSGASEPLEPAVESRAAAAKHGEATGSSRRYHHSIATKAASSATVIRAASLAISAASSASRAAIRQMSTVRSTTSTRPCSTAKTFNYANNRLSFEQLQQRKAELQSNKDKAKNIGKAIAMLDPSQSIASVASAEDIGDVCHYVIDEPVTLPRQKSAMLPIVKQKVDASEGQHLQRIGPRQVSAARAEIQEHGHAAADAGADHGLRRHEPTPAIRACRTCNPARNGCSPTPSTPAPRSRSKARTRPIRLDAVKVVKGVMQATHKLRQTRTYFIKNRSDQDRTLLVEHPVREDWRLVTPEKPAERSRDVYRFQVYGTGRQVAHSRRGRGGTADRSDAVESVHGRCVDSVFPATQLSPARP